MMISKVDIFRQVRVWNRNGSDPKARAFNYPAELLGVMEDKRGRKIARVRPMDHTGSKPKFVPLENIEEVACD